MTRRELFVKRLGEYVAYAIIFGAIVALLAASASFSYWLLTAVFGGGR